MTLLALDPGLSLGWACSDGRSGTLNLKAFPDRGLALVFFSNWLQGEIRRHDLLVIETPVLRAASRYADFQHGLVWTAHSVAARHNVARREYRADEVRKHLLGRARRKKGETVREFDAEIRAKVEALGYDPDTEHAADACALLCLACVSMAGIITPVPP